MWHGVSTSCVTACKGTVLGNARLGMTSPTLASAIRITNDERPEQGQGGDRARGRSFAFWPNLA